MLAVFATVVAGALEGSQMACLIKEKRYSGRCFFRRLAGRSRVEIND